MLHAGLVFVAVHRLLVAVTSRRGAGLQGAQAQWLWGMGLVALRLVESSRIRDQTHVPCTGRQILIHWTTREVHQLGSAATFESNGLSLDSETGKEGHEWGSLEVSD